MLLTVRNFFHLQCVNGNSKKNSETNLDQPNFCNYCIWYKLLKIYNFFQITSQLTHSHTCAHTLVVQKQLPTFLWHYCYDCAELAPLKYNSSIDLTVGNFLFLICSWVIDIAIMGPKFSIVSIICREHNVM